MKHDEMVHGIANAIAAMEGFNRQDTLARRNNNPGNIRSWGNVPVRSGYACFPTEAAGWKALHRQITLNIQRSLTMAEFFAGKPGVYSGYAPAADSNRPGHYAQYVAGKVGIEDTSAFNRVDRIIKDCIDK